MIMMAILAASLPSLPWCLMVAMRYDKSGFKLLRTHLGVHLMECTCAFWRGSKDVHGFGQGESM